MTDPAFNLLLEQLNPSGMLLLIADENLRDAPLSALPAQTVLLSNRFDLQQQGCAAGLVSLFSDFNFSRFEKGQFDQLLYRVSKEKPIVHHILNSAKRLLKNGGQLLLAGSKNEGLKTYAKKAEQCFGSPVQVSKQGLVYLARVSSDGGETASVLDDQNYPELRQLPALQIDDALTLYSKPGLFGWNKIDRGSALLTACLDDFFGRFATEPQQLLDLGCGYGYLSVMAQRRLPQVNITATDNNAAAVLACRNNFALAGIKGQIIADDCGDNLIQDLIQDLSQNLDKKYDAVLCNPPFHQGFDSEGEMTDRFLRASHRLLRHGGMALFVVNRFVPLERKAGGLFASVATMEDNSSFKVILLKK